MISLWMIVISFLLIAVTGLIYSRFLARQWGEDPGRKTPATQYEDGRDYVPTPTPVVFAHHFASIAGAGPIIGPVLALCFGWGPAIVWVVLGGLFVGGLHDYLAAFMSLRNKGQSVAMIARRLLGRGPFLALMIFLVVILGMVTAVFLNTSASALVSMIELGRMQVDAVHSIFRTVVENGQQKVVIGGIASTSVIVITALAPLVGWMYIRKQVSVWKCSISAVAICVVSIVVGLCYPVTLSPGVWKILLSVYVLVAAGVPVWIFLQSRDFINVHILYVGIAFLVVALIVGSLRGGIADASAALPALDMATGTSKLGGIWPALFITIACGAVSGFHSLCAGGTTCKQLKAEGAARYIGYWAMLLETVLATVVIATLVMGTTRVFYMEDVFPVGQDNNPVLGFAFAVGRSGYMAFGLPIAAGALAGMLLLEGFVITTLDTAVRLNRYLIEEIWQEFFGKFDIFAAKRTAVTAAEETAGSSSIPAGIDVHPDTNTSPPIATKGVFRAFLRVLSYYWVNSGIAAGMMLWLSFSGSILQLWKVFGTANQLLASFTLGIGCVWLLRNGKRVWYVVVPAVFMLATTATSLYLLLGKFVPHALPDGTAGGNRTLFVADIVLISLTAYLVVAGVREIILLLLKGRTQSRPA